MPIDPFSRFPSAGKTDLEARLGLSRRQEPEVSDLEIARVRSARQHARYAARRSPDLASADFQIASRKEARQRSERVRKTDSTLIAELLSGLVQGRLIGLLENENFSDARQGFLSALQELGRVVQAPNLPANSASKSDASAEMFALGLGITRETARKIAASKSRVVRRFDSFMASMPAEPATLQAALDAGSLDGLPAGFLDLISALIGAVRGAALSNDSAALRQIGEDFGAVAFALMSATGGTPDASTAQRSYQFSDQVRVKKGAVEISKNFWVDEEDVVWGEDGQPRLRKGASAKPRYVAVREGK